jgi:hypothetical protein
MVPGYGDKPANRAILRLPTIMNAGRTQMGRILASLVVAACLLSVASSEASAWVCRAVGVGSGGMGRGASVADAKFQALRRCEHRGPVPVCTILWCRPGG